MATLSALAATATATATLLLAPPTAAALGFTTLTTLMLWLLLLLLLKEEKLRELLHELHCLGKLLANGGGRDGRGGALLGAGLLPQCL